MGATNSVVYPRLYLYSQQNYQGQRFVWRGNIALRNLDNLYSSLGSLQFFSPNIGGTLVLFSRPNFQGRYRIFRGSVNIPDLSRVIAGSDPESLIISKYPLTLGQIKAIQRTGNVPSKFRVE